MKPWVLFVAARHFRTKRREKGHTAGILSIIGIAAGVMTLISVLAVMNGFQSGTIEDLLEVGSYHLQTDTVADPDAIDAVRGVAAVVPFAESFSLISGFFPDPLAAFVRAVPSDIRERDARFDNNVEIVSGQWDLSEGTLVVGQELARRLGVRVGDEVQLVSFTGSLTEPEQISATVTGVFKTGFLEYDTGWSYISLGWARGLGLAEPTRIGIKIVDRFRDRQVSRRILSSIPDIELGSWREFNRAIFGALRLEKTLMMVLVGLIFVVVGVNIYQSLRRSVVERTEEIGVLKAIGGDPTLLQQVFLMEGLGIGLVGGLAGLGLGIAVSRNINGLFTLAETIINGLGTAWNWVVGLFSTGDAANQSFAIFSPAYFYIDEVPAVLFPLEVAGIVIFAIASAAIAALVASRRVSGILPAEVLRYE